MKVIIALAVLVAVAAARPDAADPSATILRYDNSQPGPEGFNWSFETSDGISQQQKGELKDAGTEHAAIHYTGEYSYKDPKTGHTIKVVYTATDAGYHSQTTIE